MLEVKIEKIHCNDCGQKTRHALLHETKQEYQEDMGANFSFDATTTYQTLQCLGCEAITLKRTAVHSEMGEFDQPDITYYPPRVSRKLPNWLDQLEYEDKRLMEEIYTALHADSRSLAMMGARALFDAFIRRNKCECAHGGFAAGLQKLLDEGFITKHDKPLIEAAIEAGNASAHRAHRPKREHMNLVMNTLENLLHQELLRTEAADLKKATPQRQKPSKTATTKAKTGTSKN